jgi:hypothetical protein
MKVKLGFGIGTLVMKMAGRSSRQLYVPQLRTVRSQNFGHLLRSMAYAQRTSRRRSTKSRKKCMVQKAIENNFGVNQIDVQNGFYMEHIYFVILWELVSSVHLGHEVPDNIKWKLNDDGKYSTLSAYKCNLKALSLQP